MRLGMGAVRARDTAQRQMKWSFTAAVGIIHSGRSARARQCAAAANARFGELIPRRLVLEVDQDVDLQGAQPEVSRAI